MCVLHVTSKSNSFAEYLKRNALPIYRSHEKGDCRSRRKPIKFDDYGLSCVVSDKEWTDLKGQIEDALEFLGKHENELRALMTGHVIDDIRLDFPYSCRLNEVIVAQYDYLPPKLLRLAGDLGIGIELSHYPPVAWEDERDGTAEDT